MGFLNCLRYGNFFKVMGFIGATVHHCWQVFVIECIRNTRRVCQIFSKNIWTRVHLVDPCRMMHWPCKSLKFSFLKWFWRCLENNEKTVGSIEKWSGNLSKSTLIQNCQFFTNSSPFLRRTQTIFQTGIPVWAPKLGRKTQVELYFLYSLLDIYIYLSFYMSILFIKRRQKR